MYIFSYLQCLVKRDKRDNSQISSVKWKDACVFALSYSLYNRWDKVQQKRICLRHYHVMHVLPSAIITAHTSKPLMCKMSACYQPHDSKTSVLSVELLVAFVDTFFLSATFCQQWSQICMCLSCFSVNVSWKISAIKWYVMGNTKFLFVNESPL